MACFSERYGYVPLQTAIIKDSMPEEVINALCTFIDLLLKQAREERNDSFNMDNIEMQIWCYFLRKRRNDIFNYQGYQKAVIVPFLLDNDNPWYRKLDMIEYMFQTMEHMSYKNSILKDLLLQCVKYVNTQFKDLHYGYRLIDFCITPITSDEEIEAIETAIANCKDNVHTHLTEAISLFSNREKPNYRNSIKESISAVEVVCRELTGENTLGEALKALEKNGIVIHNQLKSAFEKLYAYTNQEGTGVRHGLMESTGNYVPSYNEAYFMLVSCSAFINYLRGITA